MRSKKKGLGRAEIESIRKKVRLEDVVEAELGRGLKQGGNSWSTNCPFHEDSTPSFRVYEDGHYFCFGCERYGDVFEFLMERKKIGFREAVNAAKAYMVDSVSENPVLTLPSTVISDERRDALLESVVSFYSRSLTEEARTYLRNRGLSPQTVENFRLGYGGNIFPHLESAGYSVEEGVAAGVLMRTRAGTIKDTFLGRIVVPYLRRDKVAYLIGRQLVVDPDEGPLYMKLPGVSVPGFINEDALDRDGLSEIWLVEGPFDCLVAAQAGIPCLGVGGLNVKSEWIERIPKKTPVTICFDGDTPGKEGAEKLGIAIVKSGRAGRIVHLPEGQDPDDYLLKNSADALRQLGEKSLPLKVVAKRVVDSDAEPERTSFKDLGAGGLVEMVYDPDTQAVQLAHFREGQLSYVDELSLDDGRIIRPYSSGALVQSGVLHLPSRAEEYTDDARLLSEVQAFIAKYVGVSPFYETVTAHYVLLTWIYDCFPVVPYLRVRGDFGSGKTRFQEVAGALTYKTIMCTGAVTIAPLFRLIERYRGTFIIDEADFRSSEAEDDIIKILNTGYKHNAVVLRCEADTFEPQPFRVYGPKILGTRKKFGDQALESRCLTEDMDGSYREGIPKHLPPSFGREALKLRNKLLLWRFRHYGLRELDRALEIPGIEPRLNEVALPLLTVIQSPDVRAGLQRQFQAYNRTLIQDRAMSKEGHVLEIICELYPQHKNDGTPLTMKVIADRLTLQANPEAWSAARNEYHKTRPGRVVGDHDRDEAGIQALFRQRAKKQWSPHTVGHLVGDVLKLEKIRTRNGWCIDISDANERVLERLRLKYGIESVAAVRPDVAGVSAGDEEWGDGEQL